MSSGSSAKIWLGLPDYYDDRDFLMEQIKQLKRETSRCMMDPSSTNSHKLQRNISVDVVYTAWGLRYASTVTV